MIEQQLNTQKALRAIIIGAGLIGLIILSGLIAATPYGLLLVFAFLGGIGCLVWFKLGTYRELLIFVFLSHFLVLFLKITATILPTQYTALLPSLVVGLLYVAVFLQLGNNGFRVSITYLDLLVAGYILLSFLQIFNSHITLVFGLRSFQNMAFFAGMYFVSRYVVTSRERAYAVISLLSVTVALAALYAVLQSVFNFSLERGYATLLLERGSDSKVALAQERSYGTLISQTQYGGMSALGVLTAFAWLKIAKGKQWWIAMISFFANTIGLLLSGTRTSMLALVIAMLIVSCLKKKRKITRKHFLRIKKHLLWGWSIAIILLVFLVFFLSTSNSGIVENTLHRVQTILPSAWLEGEITGDRNVQGRFYLWRQTWRGIIERPILGYGVGILKGGSDRQNVGTVNGMRVVENQYLQLWGELGIFGLLLYCAILTFGAFIGIRWYRCHHVQAFAGLIFATVIFIAFASVSSPPLMMYPANVFFWIFLGIAQNIRYFKIDS